MYTFYTISLSMALLTVWMRLESSLFSLVVILAAITGLETPQAQRYRRMSQTVRARTTRWVEGRFRDSLLGESTPGRKDLAEALEAMAEGSITPGPMSPIALPGPVPEEEDEHSEEEEEQAPERVTRSKANGNSKAPVRRSKRVASSTAPQRKSQRLRGKNAH